ncbi:MAG: amidohydrolase/deacetylase family metallohydrolase [Planctomycetota bacterium]|jgi:dihydroorotase
MSTFDLLLKNGTLIDPAAGRHELADVAITAGRVREILMPGNDAIAIETVDCDGLIVAPGLIDFHVHVYPSISHFGVDPDSTCLSRGVTTVVDFGTAGGLTWDGFRNFVMDRVQTRIFGLVHIAAQGMLSTPPGPSPALGELHDLDWCDIDCAAQAVERHRDRAVGIKIRCTENLARNGQNEAEGLQLARKASDVAGVPLVIHSPDSSLSTAQILDALGPGDVLTHCYHGKRCGLVDDNLQLLPVARDALQRGVLLDLGHGSGSFSFPVAHALMDQGIVPHFLSSDIHTYNVHGPVFDLVTTLDKFLHLGLSIDDVIRKATAEPARFLGRSEELGTLQPGALADVTILSIEEGEFPLIDSNGAVETGHQRLEVQHVFRGGVRCGVLPRSQPPSTE